MAYSWTTYNGLPVITPDPATGTPARNINDAIKTLSDNVLTATEAASNVETNVESLQSSLATLQTTVGAIANLSITEQYVIHVAKNGNDTTGDGSILKPYLTVQAALTAVAATNAANYKIQIGPGLYDEIATFTFPTERECCLSVIGAGYRSVTVIKGLSFTNTDTSHVKRLFLENFSISDESQWFTTPSTEAGLNLISSGTTWLATLSKMDINGFTSNIGIAVTGTHSNLMGLGLKSVGVNAAFAIICQGGTMQAGDSWFSSSSVGNHDLVFAPGMNVQINGTTIGALKTVGSGNSVANVYVQSGTGGLYQFGTCLFYNDTGNTITCDATGAAVQVGEITLVHQSGGTISNANGAVVAGITTDNNGAVIPVSAASVLYANKATTTAFSPTTSTNWTSTPTTVQSALDSLAARQGSTTNLLTNGDFSNSTTGWTTGNQQEPNEDGSGGTDATSTFSVANNVLTINRKQSTATGDWVTGYAYQAVSVAAGTKVKLTGNWAGSPASNGGNTTSWWAEIMLVSLPSAYTLTESPTTYGFTGVFAYPSTAPTYGKYAGKETSIIRAIVSYPGNVANFGGNGGLVVHSSNYYNSFGANGISSVNPTWTSEDFAKWGLYSWEKMKATMTTTKQDPLWRQQKDCVEPTVISKGTVLVILKYGSKYSNDGSVSFGNLKLTAV
jgi:hypothetical protein